jgi:Glycosyl transferase family 2
MQLAAITTVRNECDIIEAFVRHNAAFCDRLYVLDHRSTDATPNILRELADEGLPLTLSHDDEAVFYQGPKMTQLIKGAMADRDWDFVLPLDGDEFICAPDRAALEAALSGLGEGTVGLWDVVNYIPTANDDSAEKDVLRRIVHRTRTIPDISCKIGKVTIPGAVVEQPNFSLNEGNHGVCVDGKPIAERRLDRLGLAHFPVRSADQFVKRAILYRLAWGSRSDYNPSWDWHYGTFIEQLKSKPAITAADLTEAALLYVDIYNESGQTPHQKVLMFDPATPAYDRLRFTDLIDVAVLPPILDMMDALLGELREARNAGTRRSRLRELFRIGKRKSGIVR